ncbi:putative monooxygenase [Aspergillus flavus]|uniref:Monooxygenase n=1 Tax=Aspergillus flavus (strain ATCC 200026 / FGSC A1120 / IAM 13836 / NRRL 3357 / JCM 12722 / SRRC 167) TaxID=332952 RepID=A0A7U2MHK2_ASPFN|nr:putative monooxygenase [Aspergillus flavus]
MASKSTDVPTYSQIACVGAGLSAVALGATLQRWYGLEDIQFFERHPTSGGTWYINSYPGCGCDVPSALYSFSFAPNPNWTKLMPSNKEIKEYIDDVVDTYNLLPKMSFETEVVRTVWREDANRWLLYLRELKTGREYTHECQILFAATGQLVEPRPCEIPGASDFRGSIFHSARWDHSVDLNGKNVVVIGNGCTAAQIVPALANSGQVKSLTQIVRTKHWIFPAPNFTYPKVLQWIFRYVPLAMKLHRLHIFLVAENDFRLFPMTKGAARLREKRRKQVEKYMREASPRKYHDLLIPDFDVGCKRRIFDPGYLESLHQDNVLLTDAKTERITEEGIETDKGFIPADVIVLATGFQTNKFIPYMDVVGRNGETVSKHWGRYGGPAAYNCSALNGFPNFFILLGPNAATGHTSAMMAAENSINYALRILKPVLDGDASSVEVTAKAEHDYAYWVQDALSKRVWNAGCVSWYLNDQKWNSMSYPWTQGHYWWRSLFPTWSDWTIKVRQLSCVPSDRHAHTDS